MQYRNENELVQDIWKNILKTYPDAYLIKIHGGMYQEAGIPDLLVMVRGLLIGIEVKNQRPGESREHALSRTTLRQRQHIARMVKAGGMAGVALDVDTALYLIKLAILKNKKMAAGVPDLPLPPDWDTLIEVPASSVVTVTEVQVSPVPIHKSKSKTRRKN